MLFAPSPASNRVIQVPVLRPQVILRVVTAGFLWKPPVFDQVFDTLSFP
jgi:hypothetical protein